MLFLPKKMNVSRAEKTLKIGFVYSRIPFPMMRGDQLTVAHLLSFLSARGHEVDFHTLDVDGEMKVEQMEWLKAACTNVNIYRQSVVSKVLGLLSGVANSLPMQVGIFRNGKMFREVRKNIAQGKYDILYVYYIRSAPILSDKEVAYFKANQGQKASFLALQLSQILNTERIYKNEGNVLKKIVYWFEYALLRKYETTVWSNFTRSVLIGDRDVEAITKECDALNVRKIDNWVYGAHGTDTDKFQPATREEIVRHRVVFSGSMLYAPNVQAVLWFVENCWPKIRAEVPDAEFIVQGRDPVEQIRALHGKDNIVVTGTVADVGVVIRSAAVCINPMLAAGGMQNKLIEYMACGKAVVASSIANEGIGAPGASLLIANGAEDFSSSVVRLLLNDDQAEELGQRARAYILKEWTWEAHFMKLENEFYKSTGG